jgi:beta-glucosidase
MGLSRALRAALTCALLCGSLPAAAEAGVSGHGQGHAYGTGNTSGHGHGYGNGHGHAPTPAERAQALVQQMTLDEEISLVHGTGFITGNGYTGFTPAIARLGIPAFYLADGPNGVGNGARGVTAFPAAINNAASWDTSLLNQYGQVLGAEHAGKGNDVALAPTMNIVRVPGWGRAFETFSEDPELAGDVGAAEIRGIQSQGVIADAKHFAANNQETDRQTVNAVVPERALREIYTAQFAKAVQDGGVLSVMCAYNQVNGAYACENPHLLTDILKRDLGFGGFVVSDWFANHSTVAAANAGLDLEMPGGNTIFGLPSPFPERFGADLKAAVQNGQVPKARLDDMVRRILAARIAEGQLDRTTTGSHDAVVTTPEHQQFATQLSEQGTVLLKDARGALPIDSQRVHSLAVIGAAAQNAPIYTGGGSATVNPSGTVTPLAGITARAGQNVNVTYAPGTAGTAEPPLIATARLTPASGTGKGLTAQYFASSDLSGTPAITRVDPTVQVTGNPPGLSGIWSARWTGTFTPTVSGLQRFSFSGSGIARLYINGKLVLDSANQLSIVAVDLPAGQPAQIRVEYIAKPGFAGLFPPSLRLGWSPPNPAQWQQAIDAARTSDMAVVFVNDIRTEGADLPTLALPGDQDALIEAVAAANPNTVVVLDTGGPTLTPWRDQVAGLFEAWYPGQQNGDAIAALLFGDANPSGRLPVTFPASDAQGPLTSPSRFPGVNDVASYDEGLLVGYRWYDAIGQQPAYPFGYGLSYTSFAYDRLHVHPWRHGDLAVRVRVRNTGGRAGAEVVQLYVGFPASAGEPPRVLKAFQKVQLAPGQKANVTLTLGPRDLSVWSDTRNGWYTPGGRYTVMVGSSSRDIRGTASFWRRGW